jgi:hypothetical protein
VAGLRPVKPLSKDPSGFLAPAYETFVRRDNPTATSARNRLDSTRARNKVSSRYTDQSPGTLQDRLTVYHLADNPVGDFLRLNGSSRLLWQVSCGDGAEAWTTPGVVLGVALLARAGA